MNINRIIISGKDLAEKGILLPLSVKLANMEFQGLLAYSQNICFNKSLFHTANLTFGLNNEYTLEGYMNPSFIINYKMENANPNIDYVLAYTD